MCFISVKCCHLNYDGERQGFWSDPAKLLFYSPHTGQYIFAFIVTRHLILDYPIYLSTSNFFHITAIVCCLHWRKITECGDCKFLSLTKFSQPCKLHICATLSLFSLLVALTFFISCYCYSSTYIILIMNN